MLESGYTGMSDSVWMTKAEFAAARRISIGSANRLIRQRRWERQPGDDGRTRVLVPRPWAEGKVSSSAAAKAALMESSLEATTGCDGQPGIVNTLREAVIRLEAETELARSGCRRIALERDEERQARMAAEHALSEARQQAAEAVRAAESLRKANEIAAAEERAEQITREAAFAQLRRLTETMAARRSLGLWGRLRLAWRGE